MPAYNAEATCKAAIESATRSEYDIELLIIDDGSKDATLKTCEDMQCRDPRIRVYSKKNGGVSSARNMGLQLARGEYIAFLDSDDKLAEEYMNVIMPLLEQEPDVIVFGYRLVQHGKQVASSFMPETQDVKQLWEAMLGPNGGLNPPWNKVYKRRLITEEFNTSKHMGEDLEFCCAYLKNIRSCIVIRDQLYCYQVDSENSLTKKLGIVLGSVVEDMQVISDYAQAVGVDDSILADKLYQRTEGILGGCRRFQEYKTAVSYFKNDKEYLRLRDSWEPKKRKNKILRYMMVNERWRLLFLYLRGKRIIRKIVRKW